MILHWEQELEVCLRAILCGIALRAVYDFFLIRRSFCDPGTERLLLDSAEDLIYWIFCGTVVFTVLYHYNSGIPRGYLYLAVGGGMLLYHFGPSSYVVRAVHRICLTLKKIFERRIKKPLQIAGKHLQKHVKSITIKAEKSLREASRSRKKRASAAGTKRNTKKSGKERTAGEKKKKKAGGRK